MNFDRPFLWILRLLVRGARRLHCLKIVMVGASIYGMVDIFGGREAFRYLKQEAERARRKN